MTDRSHGGAARLLATITAALSVAGLAAAVASLVGLGLLSGAGAAVHAVASDSMVPAFARGDLVVTRPVAEPEVGDMVTFRRFDRLVTHRIVAPGRVAGTWETRGDANPGNDPWTVSVDDITGRVVGVVPEFGHALLVAETVRGRLLGLNLAGVLLLALNWAWPRAVRGARVSTLAADTA